MNPVEIAKERYEGILQGTDEWKSIRLGKLTSSHSVDICKGTRGSYLASRKNYIATKALEILTKKYNEEKTTFSMTQGIEREPFGREAYEIYTGKWVDQIAFIDHPTIERYGGSPDGLIDEDKEGPGGLELKCLEPAQHFAFIFGGLDELKDGRKYLYQIQSNLSCSLRNWWDLALWNPDFPENLQLIIKRFYPNVKIIKEIESEVITVNKDVDELIKKCTAIMKSSLSFNDLRERGLL